MPALWPQLPRWTGPAAYVLPPNLAHLDEPWLAHPLGDGRVIVAMSWEALLLRLHGAVDNSGDPAATSDLAQLDGLVASQIATGYIPVSPGDLTGRTGQQVLGLRDAVLAAAAKVSFGRANNGASDDGPGRWVVLPGDGRNFWVESTSRERATMGRSPIWAHCLES